MAAVVQCELPLAVMLIQALLTISAGYGVQYYIV